MLSVGQILSNRYRIQALLGQGGFGAVYKAIDLNIDFAVAVKENQDVSPEAQRQFQHEGALLVRLRHSALPRVTDTFFIAGQGQYLVMDYIEGLDLQQTVNQYGPLDEARATAWMGQVLDALAYLHSQHPPVIHRDVKPANIKITPDGRAVLVDFGLAKLYDPRLLTTTGARAVTPGYSPLEQYGHGGTDARSDVYAAGATLYALLTGQVPPEAIDLAMGSAQIVPPRQLNPHLSPHIEAVILRALTTQPTGRYADGGQMRAALQLSQPAVSYAALPVSPQAAQPPQPVGNARLPARIATALLPELILIPAGPFLMGSDPKKDRDAQPNEQPQHTVHLPDYYIARTPITNAQYLAFVQATGREFPQHWKNGQIPQGYEAHPVVNVTWRDALAFCQWVTEQLQLTSTLLAKFVIRLPSEAEWEKAARGTDGRIYPWGNELPDERRCNLNCKAGGTTPVGSYSPQGDSPYGCLDMAGNVWEWCSSRNRPYPYRPDDGREDLDASAHPWRVLRGGASFRCAFRSDVHCATVGGCSGFRCCGFPPSPSSGPYTLIHTEGAL